MKSAVNVDKLRELYSEEGMSVEDIAQHFRCSTHNIKRVLQKNKIRRGSIKGYRAWNKGKNKSSDPTLAKMSSERTGSGNPMFGKEAWNKGKTKLTDASISAVSKKLRGRDISPETREKLAEAKRGKCGKEANNWQGGRSYINHLGYLMNRFTRDGRRWYEHRWVAWKHIIGERDFLPDEDVHHIDRDRLNNTPENLMVLSRSDHLRLHIAIKESGVSSRDEQISFLKENNIKFEVYNG